MYLTTDTHGFRELCSARDSFESLAELALEELAKFPPGVEIVCGPITSGGAGSIKDNLTIFNAVIKRLLEQRRPVFNQMPYENQLFALRDAWKADPDALQERGYEPVLEQFYRPLFSSERFAKAWFIPKWETSSGATWERNLLRSLGVEFEDLSEDWVTGALRGLW